jgi:hypothetical protein
MAVVLPQAKAHNGASFDMNNAGTPKVSNIISQYLDVRVPK